MTNSCGKDFKGFTLIEAVISIFLLSLLMLIAFQAFRFAIDTFEKNYSLQPEKATKIGSLRGSLRSVFTYVYKNREGEDALYFLGTSDTLSYISAVSILGLTPPVVSSVLLKDSCLIYREFPLFSEETDYLKVKYYGEPKSCKLICDIKSIRLSYQKSKNTAKEIHGKIPDYIFIELTEKSGKKQEFVFEVKAKYPDKLTITKLLEQQSGF